MEYHLNYDEYKVIKTIEKDKFICLTSGELSFLLFETKNVSFFDNTGQL